ncbi:MAG TPA: diacylglycerol kinase family protein [Actinomycetaceae bacterium]|nr:diacylglycerol kinase family protein [Actinomycetaceae bacterium]
MRIGLLVNPSAGRTRAARYHAGIAGVLRKAGHLVVDLTGPDAQSARVNARAHLGEMDALIVMGGDGAVQLALNVVAGTAIPLGIVPVGTGNDNATGLGLSRDPREALRLVLRQMAEAPAGVPTDAISVTTSRGTQWAMATLSCSIDAVVNERANNLKHPRNGFRYVRAVLEVVPRYKAATYRVRADDREWEGEALLVCISNIGYIGGGMHIAPEARPDDGLLDLIIAKGGLGTREILTVFPRVFNGSHVRHPAVFSMQARKLELEADRPQIVYADGEYIGDLPLSCEAVPNAVNVYRPPTPPTRSERARAAEETRP